MTNTNETARWVIDSTAPCTMDPRAKLIELHDELSGATASVIAHARRLEVVFRGSGAASKRERTARAAATAHAFAANAFDLLGDLADSDPLEFDVAVRIAGESAYFTLTGPDASCSAIGAMFCDELANILC